MAIFAMLRSLLVPLVLYAVQIEAAPTADTQAACAALKTAYPTALAYPTDPTFAAGRKYWSGTAKDAGVPACIFYPTSAQAVSDGVSALLRYPSVQFAMKSGGHSPNAGFNNVDGGVLFAFSGLANTVISSDRQTAEVGPGARWMDVISALEPYGKAVVGGRIGTFGSSQSVQLGADWHRRKCGSRWLSPGRRVVVPLSVSLENGVEFLELISSTANMDLHATMSLAMRLSLPTLRLSTQLRPRIPICSLL